MGHGALRLGRAVSAAPLFSVIVPTRDRPENVCTCLAALAEQRLASERFEVIVVDDGSATPIDPATFASIAIPATVVRQANRGPAAARNAGAALARGTLLAFLDDDCLPAPDWLEALEARSLAEPGAALGGRTVNALPENPFSTASHLLSEYLVGYLNVDPACSRFHASNNFVVPADAFHAVGGFDETFSIAAAEDREFCGRWLAGGRRLVGAPLAIVRHAHRLTLRSFCRQHMQYGRGAARYRQVRRSTGAARLRREPFSFYTGMLRHPFDSGSGAGLAHSALIGLSQVVYVAGYLGARLSGGREPGRER